MVGRIVKGIGSFYTVICDGVEYVCKARGRFRKEGITPVPGDFAQFEPGKKEGNGFICEIMPRKNLLIRPAVANIDKLVIVISATAPKPDLYLVDKLTTTCELSNIEPVILINKCDNRDLESEISKIKAEYELTGYKLLTVSALTGFGIEELKQELKGSTACFAGQSAVGKSSILNVIMPKLMLETGGLSRKTERGRHTTRHAELWITEEGSLFDTPGFSLLELMTIEPVKLAELYPEMKQYCNMCRFVGCSHINEPDCAIKELVESGKLSRGRYERYKELYAELNEAYKHRFD